MKTLSTKGDIKESLKTLLDDKEQIKSEGMQLKQMFLEILLTKYGASLEHITRGFEKVSNILEEHYKDSKESQTMVIETIFKSFSLD